MADNAQDKNSMPNLLSELLEIEKKRQPTVFQGFMEAANKFKDAATSLENFLNSFLTDAKRREIETIRLNNLHHFTGLSTEMLFDVGQLSKSMGGSQDEAGTLAKHLLEMNENNPKDLNELGKAGFKTGEFFNEKGQLKEDVFSLLQEQLTQLTSSKPKKAHEILKLLGLNENGLGAVLSSKKGDYNIKKQREDRNKNSFSSAAPSQKNIEDSRMLLLRSTHLGAFSDKAHLDEISMLAPKLEKIADALVAIEKSHPELVAKGLMSLHGAILLFLTTNSVAAGVGLAYGSLALAKKAGPVVSTGKNLLKTGTKASIGLATRSASQISKTALGVLGGAGLEEVGAAEIATLGVEALLAPEIIIPLSLIGGGVALFKWWEHHQKAVAKSNSSAAPEVSDFLSQADQGQVAKLQNFQQQATYFQTLHQKEQQGLGTRPLSLSFGNINVETRKEDDPFAFAEAVKQVVGEELMKVIATFSPYR